ncbi:response regulator transcription factor [Sulfurimonas paralvinellae]|uniref:Response regulator transcription factor n=1 Tax=Sulfurimonas paralvinellae TaxID=317658 RepID=A0A7M1B605_9BACT|nr:response regulator transcription factor [Sulfurimonas paralvinellae]QOP45169.1 response regulator transcription factor [Sulfurimonas paralvinellae]
MDIVLYSDNINLLSHWEKALKNEQYKSIDDLEDLHNIENSIIIVNYAACQNRCQSLLSELRERGNRLLVLDRVPELDTAKRLLKYGAMGYGNALMRDHFILAAVAALREGMVWLHPQLTSQLILEIPESQDANEELLQKLTSRERETALLLKEGLTYNEIAERLEISPRTVKAHAQGIYKKLNVSDRIGLALLLK